MKYIPLNNLKQSIESLEVDKMGDSCFLCGLEIENDSFALFSDYGEMIDIIHKDCYRTCIEKVSNKQKVINFELLINNEEVR